jgi:hypothetical protein
MVSIFIYFTRRVKIETIQRLAAGQLSTSQDEWNESVCLYNEKLGRSMLHA